MSLATHLPKQGASFLRRSGRVHEVLAEPPGQSYFISSCSKNTRLQRSVQESVCELLNAGFTAEHVENYKSV